MDSPTPSGVRAVRPDRALATRQRLPYFVGISADTVGAVGLSMHLIAIPPGEPHLAINLSDSEPARAIVARNDAAEQENVVPYEPPHSRFRVADC